MEIALGLLIPFVGTTLGSFMVFFMKNNISVRMENFLAGFASGVMISATMWSLLLPACEMAESFGVPIFIPTCIGFLMGASLFLLLDKFVLAHSRLVTLTSKKKRLFMLILAVTLHNIPEGMAVGAVFAGVLSHSPEVTLIGAMALSIGIAVQNFPEGAIISLPLKSHGKSKLHSFTYGTLSGIVEPISATLTLLLASFVSTLLPYFLSFAGGAMIYVVVQELIPNSQHEGGGLIATFGCMLGFTLMMLLDLALG